MRLGVLGALVDGRFVDGDIEIEDGRVVRCGLAAPGGRGLAVPGFVDLQVNGFGGVDFLDADSDGYRRAGEALLATGVTAYLPTLITSPEEKLLAALAEVPAGSRFRGSSTCRSTASAGSTSSTPTPRATAAPAMRCSRRASPPTSPP